MSGSSRLSAWLPALLLAMGGGAVMAQSGSREQEMVRRLRQQVQQLQAQQASAQAAQAAQQAELLQARDTAAGQTSALQNLQAELRRARLTSTERQQRADAVQQELQALQSERTALQQQLVQLTARQQETEATLVRARSDGGVLQTNLNRRETQLAELANRHVLQAQGLKQCIDSNQALQVLGRELLQRYADKGLVETLAVREPFLQTRRVALENLVQGYEDKLDALALSPAIAAGAAGAAGRAAP